MPPNCKINLTSNIIIILHSGLRCFSDNASLYVCKCKKCRDKVCPRFRESYLLASYGQVALFTQPTIFVISQNDAYCIALFIRIPPAWRSGGTCLRGRWRWRGCSARTWSSSGSSATPRCPATNMTTLGIGNCDILWVKISIMIASVSSIKWHLSLKVFEMSELVIQFRSTRLQWHRLQWISIATVTLFACGHWPAAGLQAAFLLHHHRQSSKSSKIQKIWHDSYNTKLLGMKN